MSLRSLLTQTVTVQTHTAGADDVFGNQADTFPSSRTYRARLEQTAEDEQVVDRDTLRTDWLLILPPEAQISGRDRVVADGVTFEVVGPPAVQRTPRGPHHIEARLTVVDAG